MYGGEVLFSLRIFSKSPEKFSKCDGMYVAQLSESPIFSLSAPLLRAEQNIGTPLTTVRKRNLINFCCVSRSPRSLQLQIRSTIPNDPYFHLSATFLFPNGNEERLNVGAEEYVLPPWFDKEPFGALSEPFERKRLDLRIIVVDSERPEDMESGEVVVIITYRKRDDDSASGIEVE
ncbi:hypothetical protein CEXT_422681 [Caerostris extrusa]|uniref:Uncharacterized protein n=1 Tax=Caerostris extrusa TaxID=172846 RepID=A0AAV4XZB1_CAEEX|nr:hypothetical protein CEXT_422681 [Caerostris extrusa]